EFRRLWIARINAAARMQGLSYSRLIDGLNKAGVEVNRKVLADLAVNDARAFGELVSVAKQQLGGEFALHMTRVITSVDNARVKAARALSRPKRRRETGLCLLEGARAIETALEAGAVVRDVFAAPAARAGQRGRALLERLAQAGAAVFDVTERVLQSISATETPQGIVATAVIPAAGPEEFAGVAAVLVADRIGDPGNLGTMARTAAAVGAGLWTTFGSADLFDPKALRASA